MTTSQGVKFFSRGESSFSNAKFVGPVGSRPLLTRMVGARFGRGFVVRKDNVSDGGNRLAFPGQFARATLVALIVTSLVHV